MQPRQCDACVLLATCLCEPAACSTLCAVAREGGPVSPECAAAVWSVRCMNAHWVSHRKRWYVCCYAHWPCCSWHAVDWVLSACDCSCGSSCAWRVWLASSTGVMSSAFLHLAPTCWRVVWPVRFAVSLHGVHLTGRTPSCTHARCQNTAAVLAIGMLKNTKVWKVYVSKHNISYQRVQVLRPIFSQLHGCLQIWRRYALACAGNMLRAAWKALIIS